MSTGECEMTNADQSTAEDRRKHLDFIQAVVTRMSAASSNVKSWLLPVVTVTYGFGVTQRSGAVALLGLMAVVLFMYVDANYLRQERAFRTLYDTVARQKRQVPSFSLDPSEAAEPMPPAASRRERALIVVRRWVPGWPVWRSWSILPFYGALLLIGAAVWIYATTG